MHLYEEKSSDCICGTHVDFLVVCNESWDNKLFTKIVEILYIDTK